MDLETPITLGQLILAMLTLLIPNAIMIARDLLSQKANKPLTDAQAKDVLHDAMGEAVERLGKEHSRLLTAYQALEKENAALRPLILKVALQEQKLKQSKRDKEDWKIHAERLSDQLISLGVVPIDFIRQSIIDDDSGQFKAISKKIADEIVEQYTPQDTIRSQLKKAGDTRTIPLGPGEQYGPKGKPNDPEENKE